MTRVLAWLRVPLWGASRLRWLLVLAIAGGVTLLVGPWLGGLTALIAAALRGLPGRLPVTYDTPDDAARARDALRAHSAAQEADRALAGVAAEERAAGEAARQAAATDPLDVVADRVEGRARGARPSPLSPEARKAREPPPPGDLVDALQDRIHKDGGLVRAAKVHRERKP